MKSLEALIWFLPLLVRLIVAGVLAAMRNEAAIGFGVLALLLIPTRER